MKASAASRTLDEHTSDNHSSLADALFTLTQQRVLGLLFGQPDRSFFVTQIMSLANSGSGAVQRELSRLSKSGLVTVTRAGNQKHYQANRSSPLFEELCSIVLKTIGLEEPLRAAVDALPGNIRLAMIYGSVAKRTDTSFSDIDLFIVSDDLTLEEIYAVIAPVEKRLDRRINPCLYTSKELAKRRKRKNAFLMRILEGPTIVLKGSIDAA